MANSLPHCPRTLISPGIKILMGNNNYVGCEVNYMCVIFIQVNFLPINSLLTVLQLIIHVYSLDQGTLV